MKKKWLLSLTLATSLLIGIILIPLTVVPASASSYGVFTEHFSDEAVNSTAFTSNTVGFQLDGNLSVTNAEGITGYGWTGTATDDYYVDNYYALLLGSGVVGSIQINAGAVFQAHSLYLFPGETGDWVSDGGSIIIRGKLAGNVLFTETIESTEINTSSYINNAWTYVNLGSYSSEYIDTLEFELTGSLRYLGIDAFEHECTNGPALVVTDANISISGASGTGGAYKVGDTVTVIWDNTSSGDNSADINMVWVDFTLFGGESSILASNNANKWTATYTIASGYIDSTNRNVYVTVTNTSGTTKTTADSTNATVDNILPKVTDTNISISGASGTGGAYKVGDTITASWNNTTIGDNNSDIISSVKVDFSQFGGGAAQAATNAGGTWTASYTIEAGTLDVTSRNVAVTATDNSGNSTATADTTNVTLDNIAPLVSSANISITGASGAIGAFIIGDNVTATWDNTASGDNNIDISSVTVDFSQFGGGSSVTATNTGGMWTATYTVVSGSINGVTDRNVSVAASDDGGNLSITADSTNVTVDNVAPGVSSVGVPVSATYSTGDYLVFTVNFSQNVTANTVGGKPRIVLDIGGVTKYAEYVSGSATTALVFRYTIEAGLMDSDGITVGALSLNGGILKDSNGNDAVLTLNSVGGTASVLVDAVAPVISSVVVPVDGIYSAGDNLIYTVNFSEPVTVTGTPYLTLTIGSTVVHANYWYGSGTNNFFFRYTVISGDKDADGIALASNVSLDYGTITDAVANNATLTFAGSTSSNVLVKLLQTITFGNPGAQNFGTTPVLTATSSAGGAYAVSFTSDTPEVCTITTEGVLTFLKAGTATITAHQSGDVSYMPATTVSQTFTVNPVAPGAPTSPVATAGDSQASISFTSPVYTGSADITGYTVTSDPGGMSAAGVSSPITVTGLTNGVAYTFKVTATNNVGTSVASPASNAVIPASSQTITFNNPGAQNFGTNPVLTATSSAGGGYAVSFTSDTPEVCTITTGGLLTFLKAGTATITAHQAGDASCLPAPTVSRSFTVNSVPPGAPTSVIATVGDEQASISFTPPVNNGGTYITGYTVTSHPEGITAIGASSPITITGLTNGQAYVFTVTAANIAGTGMESPPSSSVTPAFQQTITFDNPGVQNFGTTPILVATSDAGEGYFVSFTSDTPEVCTITTSGELSFLKAGTATVTAHQAGDASYLPAPTVTRSFAVIAVTPGAPTSTFATAGDTQAIISFTPPVFTGGENITGYTVTSNPGGYTASGMSSPITVNGLINGTTYTFTVTASNSAGAGMESSASNGVTPVSPQTITFDNPGAQNFGTGPTLSATSSSGLAVTFTSDTPDVCTITSAGKLTFLKAGEATIVAHQSGNSKYLSATSVSRSFAVNAVVPGAPTSVVATAGDSQASISFTPPVYTGGEDISGYIVTSSPGGYTANGTSSPITITGLTNGVAYTFAVTATNSAGTGEVSTTSNSVTPIAMTTPTPSPSPSPSPSPTPTPVAATINYSSLVQDIGWQSYVSDGVLSGTNGQAKRMEAIRINLEIEGATGGIEYKTHVQDIGWQGWVSNDALSGTSGQDKRLEAIEIQLTGEAATLYDVYYRVHVQDTGWLDWAKNGASAGTTGYSFRMEAVEIRLVAKGGVAPGSTNRPFIQKIDPIVVPTPSPAAPAIFYKIHAQDIGWQDYVSNGEVAGTSGQSKRIEGIQIKLENAVGGIEYSTHVQDIGWMDYVSDDAVSGTSGQSKRCEAIKIRLTGAAADAYDVYYSAYVQDTGWLGWAKNGEAAGTEGLSYRLEAIKIVIVPKGAPAPGATDRRFVQG